MDRVLIAPQQVLVRDAKSDVRNVVLKHRYTPAERGQILAFVWWVYVNKNVWPRRKLSAAVTTVSPLMMFSSAFLSDMTGIPASTCTKLMVKATGAPTARILGTCDMVIIHNLLEAAGSGMIEYRETVRELSVAKEVPSAMLERISGIPREVLARPDRGIDFFPEAPDRILGVICTVDQINDYWRRNRDNRRSYDPSPGPQYALRDSLAGTALANYPGFSNAPVPDENELPYHQAIPGLPNLLRTPQIGPDEFHRICEWEQRYLLPVHIRPQSERYEQ